MHAKPTTPDESVAVDLDETSSIEFVDPECPDCGSTAVTKDGTYTSESSRARVRSNPTYDSSHCLGTFLASLPSVKDGHRYADAVPDFVRTVSAFASATLYELQEICVVQCGVCPSVQQIHDWLGEQNNTAEIVVVGPSEVTTAISAPPR